MRKKTSKDFQRKNSFMDYSKIGNDLKLARERKGLSYEQIFEITRIQPSILKGIEEGEASIFPVFLKGFIKSYARSLGLDPAKLFEIAEEEGKQKGDVKQETKEPREFDRSKMQKIFKYLLLLLLGFFIVFQAIWFLDDSKKSNKDHLIVVDPEESHIGKEVVEETTIQKIDSLKKQPLEKKQSLFDQIKESVFEEELLIQSSESLEVYFKADKQSTVTKILEPSVWFQIKAKKSIYLRFDERRDDVQIFYNGKQISIGNNSFFERTFQQ